MYILIVENDPDARKLLEVVLNKHGHTICWAATGDKAIELLVTEPVDLILLDLHLDGNVSGWEVARYKITHSRTFHIPVIVMSGSVSTEEIHREAQTNVLAGAMLILQKPLDYKRLLQAIESLVTIVK